MPENVDEKIPIARALFYVALSVIVIWGALFFAWGYHRYMQSERQNNTKLLVRAIVTSTSSRDQLSCDQIAELLNLSKDEPTNLYSVDPKEAKQKLEAFPAVQQATVFRYHPNALVVDYELRKPYFTLVDFENVALDAEGYPFPLQPIYSSKKIPELSLGISSLIWNQPIDSKELETAFRIRNFQFPPELQLVKIDTHNMHAHKCGEREVVVVLQENKLRSFLRLSVHQIDEGLKKFVALRPKLQMPAEEQSLVIDLRYEGFALLHNSRIPISMSVVHR